MVHLGPVPGTVRRLRKLVEKLCLREQWNIAIVPAPASAVLRTGVLPEPRFLPTPRPGRFHADPFPVIVGDQTHILFEMWSMFNGRGWIASVPITAGQIGRPFTAVSAIDPGCHASYPSIFQFEGAVYCAPEMWEAGGLHIFRMGSDPTKWALVARVLDNIPIVDPTLFQHEGRWWLFATIRGCAPDADLHASYAVSPFGPWTEHAGNPLKSDIRSARPAGALFIVDGALHRPAQDCSGGYGSAIAINRIICLTPCRFEEITVRHLRPVADWPFPSGLHTFNACGDVVIIDAKRLFFDPLNPFWMLLPYARRLWRRAWRAVDYRQNRQ